MIGVIGLEAVSSFVALIEVIPHMSWSTHLTNLRHILASLYLTPQDANRVAVQAGLDPRFIAFDDKAINTWHNVLSEAHKRNKVAAIVDIAGQEYPENELLAELFQASQNAVDILWLANQTGLQIEEWHELYIASIPSIAVKKRPAHTLEDALDNLWDFSLQSDGTLPILMFAERLAYHTTDKPTARRLRQWVNEAPAKLNLAISQPRIQQLRAELKTTRDSKDLPESASLLVLINPHWNNPNRRSNKRFTIKVVLWKSQDDTHPLYDDDKLDMAFNEIPGKLYRILQDALKQGITPNQLTIECFLPTDLLTYPIDQWKLTDPRDPEMRYGLTYRIVVRSLERMQDISYQTACKERWEMFWCHPVTPVVNHLKWISDCHKYKPNDLYSQVELEGITCVGLTSPPTQVKFMFYELLLAGIPVMLWLRPCKEVISLEMLQSMIPHEKLHKLPHLVRELQLQATNQTNHPGNHLTLLWDDPTRVPVELTFQQPQ